MHENDKPFTVEDMLSNAACASQEVALLENATLRGAILRSFVQWLELSGVKDLSDARKQLRTHYDYNV